MIPTATFNGAVIGTVVIEAKPVRVSHRPRLYDEEMFFQICARVGRREKLADICADPNMPDEATVYRWISEDEGHARAWHYALLAKFDAIAEECIEIADDASDDLEMVVAETGSDGGGTSVKLREKKHTINRAKLMIDTRMRIAAKELPRKYADVAPMQTVPEPPGQSIAITAPTTPAPVQKQQDPLYKAIELYEKQVAQIAG